MNKIRHTFFLTVFFSWLTLLSACGSKGDLYHAKPEKPAALEEQITAPKPSINSQKQEL